MSVGLADVTRHWRHAALKGMVQPVPWKSHSLELEMKEPRSGSPVKPRCHGSGARGLGQPGGDNQAPNLTSRGRDGLTSAAHCPGLSLPETAQGPEQGRGPALLVSPTTHSSCLGRHNLCPARGALLHPPVRGCPSGASSAPTGSSSSGAPGLIHAL